MQTVLFSEKKNLGREEMSSPFSWDGVMCNEKKQRGFNKRNRTEWRFWGKR